jgi:hypothetical protein
MVITWISWGAAPGYIKIAPKGLFKAFQSDFCFSKSPVCSLLEYTNKKFLKYLEIYFLGDKRTAPESIRQPGPQNQNSKSVG